MIMNVKRWLTDNWMWVAAGAGVLLLIIGAIMGWRLMQALAIGLTGAGSAAGAGKALRDPEVEASKKLVRDTLEAKERRREEAERIKEGLK